MGIPQHFRKQACLPPSAFNQLPTSAWFLHGSEHRRHLNPAGQQHQRSGWPRPDDPVLEHLLRDFRSAKLRRQFFSHDPKEYSETLDVKVLVRCSMQHHEG